MGLFTPKEYVTELSPKSLKEVGEETTEIGKTIEEDVQPFTGATADSDGTAGLVPAPKKEQRGKYLRADGTWATPEGGSGGTSDYEDLTNKPAIDGTTLDKDSTAEGLGLVKASDLPDFSAFALKSDIPDVSGFISQETDPTVPSWAKQPNPPSPSGGGSAGSVIVVTCNEEEYIGQTIIISDEDGNTWSKTNETGAVTFEGIPSVGTITALMDDLTGAVAIQYYSKYTIVLASEILNTDFDTAYNAAHTLVTAGKADYDRTIMHYKASGYDAYKQTHSGNEYESEIPTIAWNNNMTQMKSTTPFEVDEYISAIEANGTKYDFKFLVDGYVVIAPSGNGSYNTMPSMRTSAGNVFNLLKVKANDVISCPYNGSAIVWISFYPKKVSNS